MDKTVYKTYTKLCFLYILFLTYACVVPFQLNMSLIDIRLNIDQIRWIPYLRNGHRESIMDIVSNIALFLPFGFLSATILYKKMRPVFILLLTTIFGAVLSSSQEILQLLTYDRVSSVTDVCNNAIGSLTGALISNIYHRRFGHIVKPFLIRQLKKPILEVYSVFILLGIVFFAVIPFDISLDIGDIKNSLKFTLNNLSLVPSWNYMQSSINNFLLFSIAGFCFHITYFKKKSVAIGILYTTVLLSVFALVIEIGQLFIVSRSTSISNLFFAVCGALCGAGLVRYFKWGRSPKNKMHRFFIVIYIIFFLFNYFFPFIYNPYYYNNVSRYSLIPFAIYFFRIQITSLSDLFFQIFIFIPFGFLAITNKKAYLKTFLLGFFISCLLEFFQIFVDTRYVDITDAISGGTGCFLGHYISHKFLLFRKNLAKEHKTT